MVLRRLGLYYDRVIETFRYFSPDEGTWLKWLVVKGDEDEGGGVMFYIFEKLHNCFVFFLFEIVLLLLLLLLL